MKKLTILTAILCFLAQNSFALKISSPDIKSKTKIKNLHVFNGFGCSGNNVSPRINWSDIPKGTKSFALTIYDPDAPTGSGWWHWLLVNIPKNQTELSADFGRYNKANLKDGIRQIRNDFGIYNYGGPCPPKGDKPHRYIFTIHALKVNKLDLKSDSTAALAGFMINANTIEKKSFKAYYLR